MTTTLATLPPLCHRVAGRALRWLDEAAPHFALPTDELPETMEVVDTLKPLGELAMAAYLVGREGVTGHQASRVAPRLLRFAWEQTGRGRVLLARQRRYPYSTEALEFYVWFARGGHRAPELEALLASLARTRAVGAWSEEAATRELGVLRAAGHLGLPGHAPFEEVLARTWLGRTPPPWAVDGLTLYAVTHTVYHLTDWGAEPAAVPERLVRYLGTWLPAWLEVYLEAEEWDLVAELLLVDACLPEPRWNLAAWERLAEAQRADGLLSHGPVPAPEDTAEAWRNHYHPTIAAALAATMALSRALAPGGAVPSRSGGARWNGGAR
ncbi:DUF6895 family protein [Allostreptomyces psammosilenae]|uniref:DUF6895 domain-containing protein n=1 Tax=Allostreptomyces psammosilenae TaxID=1892865 RepID=A0A852ZTE0_9ACTN|nr:hypothetical protein [Allostreptomyces psammosilenae]NYI04807.1 hypothetical protein [Allostreptomyces psammosilenae]